MTAVEMLAVKFADFLTRKNINESSSKASINPSLGNNYILFTNVKGTHFVFVYFC